MPLEMNNPQSEKLSVTRRVFDGNPIIYDLATQDASQGRVGSESTLEEDRDNLGGYARIKVMTSSQSLNGSAR